MRSIQVSPKVSSFVLACNRAEGILVLKSFQDERLLFSISPRAMGVWRIIRALLETKHPNGEVALEPGALQQFRNTDKNNAFKKNDLSEFARYIHSAGAPGCYCLRPYPKDGYSK